MASNLSETRLNGYRSIANVIVSIHEPDNYDALRYIVPVAMILLVPATCCTGPAIDVLDSKDDNLRDPSPDSVTPDFTAKV